VAAEAPLPLAASDGSFRRDVAAEDGIRERSASPTRPYAIWVRAGNGRGGGDSADSRWVCQRQGCTETGHLTDI
jgi:hypothetical protein